MHLYYEKHANVIMLKDTTIALVGGYTPQAKEQALYLKKTGQNVIFALEKDDRNREKAQEDGFDVYPIAEAVKRAEIVHFVPSKATERENYSPSLSFHPDRLYTLLKGETFTQIALFTEETPDTINNNLKMPLKVIEQIMVVENEDISRE